MGFADLSITAIAADYDTSVTEVLNLCDRLGIAYKNPQTRLALEDAKAIISEIMAQRHRSGTDLQADLSPDVNRSPAVRAGNPDHSVSSEPSAFPE